MRSYRRMPCQWMPGVFGLTCLRRYSSRLMSLRTLYPRTLRNRLRLELWLMSLWARMPNYWPLLPVFGIWSSEPLDMRLHFMPTLPVRLHSTLLLQLEHLHLRHMHRVRLWCRLHLGLRLLSVCSTRMWSNRMQDRLRTEPLNLWLRFLRTRKVRRVSWVLGPITMRMRPLHS